MSEINIYDVLKWISVIVFVILAIWYMVGDSPVEYAVVIPIFFMLFVKTFSTETRLTERVVRIETKLDNLISSFNRLADDFKNHTESYHTRRNKK